MLFVEFNVVINVKNLLKYLYIFFIISKENFPNILILIIDNKEDSRFRFKKLDEDSKSSPLLFPTVTMQRLFSI